MEQDRLLLLLVDLEALDSHRLLACDLDLVFGPCGAS